MDLYVKVRRGVMVENQSERRRTLIRHPSQHRQEDMSIRRAAGYRRTPSAISPALAPFVTIIDTILEADKQEEEFFQEMGLVKFPPTLLRRITKR